MLHIDCHHEGGGSSLTVSRDRFFRALEDFALGNCPAEWARFSVVDEGARDDVAVSYEVERCISVRDQRLCVLRAPSGKPTRIFAKRGLSLSVSVSAPLRTTTSGVLRSSEWRLCRLLSVVGLDLPLHLGLERGLGAPFPAVRCGDPPRL